MRSHDYDCTTTEAPSCGSAGVGGDDEDDVGVRRDNYVYYAKAMGLKCLAFGLGAYLACQTLDVATRMWLADWTSRGDFSSQEEQEEEEMDFITVYGVLGVSQALAYLLAVLLVNKNP